MSQEYNRNFHHLLFLGDELHISFRRHVRLHHNWSSSIKITSYLVNLNSDTKFIWILFQNNDTTYILHALAFSPRVLDVNWNPLDLVLTTNSKSYSTTISNPHRSLCHALILVFAPIYAQSQGTTTVLLGMAYGNLFHIFLGAKYASLQQTTRWSARKSQISWKWHSFRIPCRKVKTITGSSDSEENGRISDSKKWEHIGNILKRPLLKIFSYLWQERIFTCRFFQF